VSLGEFDLIARYFSRPAARRDVLLGVGDDAALLEVPADRLLVAATDTLVEGRHFLPDAPADAVGHQSLAVNLSDLAAMGAEPAWALLSLSLPAADEGWLEAFAAGLYSLAERHGVALVGGDTVRGPRVITITALGFVERGQALRRDGARPGDVLFVSGWPGEAAAGLEALRRGREPEAEHPLVRRYLYAEPRLALGRALRGKATAAMDVSDGLLGDLAMAEKNARAALPHYQKAGQLDPGYFKPMVQQGMAQYQLGNAGTAAPLLEQSMKLLPTAPGAYYLGRINEDRGNVPEAVRLYQLAAGSKSSYGEQAQARLVRLDLAHNPETYLSIQPQLDGQGRVSLLVGNRTAVPLGKVVIMVGVVDPSSGRTSYGPERVGTGTNAIPPRQAVNLRTSLGPFRSGEVLRYVRWKVESAQPAE